MSRKASLGAFLSLVGVASAAVPPPEQRVEPAARVRAVSDYGKLPLSFEVNDGQADPAVRFLARGRGYGLFLTATEAVLSLRGAKAPSTRPDAVIRMRLAGANPKPDPFGLDILPGTSNYFIGSDPAQWRTAVRSYAKVKYAAVYPGIDLVYYGRQGRLEYDFIVAPGADPSRIVLKISGVRNLALDNSGNLVIDTGSGEVVQHKPVVYQVIDGTRQTNEGRYRLKGKGRVSLEVANYDRTRPLVIDPVLVYSTYLGGVNTDWATGVAIDGDGNTYVTGYTASINFPITPGAYQPVPSNSYHAFVTKLDSTGTALVYSTYLGGGQSDDYAYAIAVDVSGNAYVTGKTYGSFPTTSGAYQTTFGGAYDVFVAKLNAFGTALVYSTYLGGDGTEVGNGIAVDGNGNAYVTGDAVAGFPTVPGAYQATATDFDAFVTKLNANGTEVAPRSWTVLRDS